MPATVRQDCASGSRVCFSVREIGLVVHPLSAKFRILGVLKAFYDDSSDGKRERVFSIGGYFGKEEEWKKFESLWAREAGETVLHMTDCLAGWGDFSNWSESARNDLLVRLIGVINSVEIFGFQSAVSVQDFKAVFPNEQKGALYFFCFQECVGQAATWASEFSEHVAVIFDDEKDFKYRAHRLFDHLKRLKDRPGWEAMQWLGTVAFESRKRFRPLQAADIIAYTGYRLVNEISLRTQAELWWVSQLNQKQRLFGELWERDDLERLKRELVESKAAGLIPYVVKRKGDAK